MEGSSDMSLLDHVDNFYEQQVLEELHNATEDQELSEDFLVDVLCVALNDLPAKYYRHRVDMMFYLSAEERRTMHENVRNAVAGALAFVRSHRRES